MIPMSSIFNKRSKFNTNFGPFSILISNLLVIFLTNYLPPPLNTLFKLCFKLFFESIPAQNAVSEVLKRGIFYILPFGGQVNGVSSSPSPNLLATLLFLIRPIQKNVITYTFFNLINAIQINQIKYSFVFPASKIAFIKLLLCQHNYLLLHKMSKTICIEL